MANDKHNMERIFREAFAAHESDVNPALWGRIEAALPQVGVAATASGASVLGKAAAVIGFAGLITAATIAEVRYQQLVHDNQHVPIHQTDQTSLEPSSSAEMKSPQVAETSAIISYSDESDATTTPKQALEVTEMPTASAASEHLEHGAQGEMESSNLQATTAESSNHSASTTIGSETETQADEQEAPKTVNSQSSAANDLRAEPEQSAQPEKTTAYFTHNGKQIITPNGDGLNDVLVIEGVDVASYHLRVMSQAGQIVFETQDIRAAWDGSDRFGNNVPAGVYFFEIIATGADGILYRESNARGSVTLVR
jgi:gliding motility-associated-like protein